MSTDRGKVRCVGVCCSTD